MKGKIALLVAAVAMVAGGLFWNGSPAAGELSSGRVAVRSECVNERELRWCFDAEDAQGQPLEKVYYTEEWTPLATEDAVEVTVRLFDAPAEGRTKLDRVAVGGSSSEAFVLTCICPGEISRKYPQASYRIQFCGRSLGSWRMDARPALALSLR